MTCPSKDRSTNHTRICEYGAITSSSRLPEDRRANAMERGDKRRYDGDSLFDNSLIRQKMTSELSNIRCF